MQGRNPSTIAKTSIRAAMAVLVAGAAASGLMVAPAVAQGYASPTSWSGPWASIGVGGVIMDTENKVAASRGERTNIDVACPGRAIDRIVETCLIGPLEPGESINASIVPAVQQQMLEINERSDAGFMGVVSAGWDLRFLDSNFLLGAFIDYQFYNVSADFSSQISAKGSAPDISISSGSNGESLADLQEIAGSDFGDEPNAGMLSEFVNALDSLDFSDERIDIHGKIEQDYAIAVGGRIGYIWNEALLTYFGAAWTRTSIDGYVNVDIADPLCGPGSFCDRLDDPTAIRINLDQEVDGYKLLIGGEYALGNALGGGFFLRAQGEYADYDGISESFFDTKQQPILNIGPNCAPNPKNGKAICLNPSVDIARKITEQASAQVEKEDYSIHAALVYKLGVGGQ